MVQPIRVHPQEISIPVVFTPPPSVSGDDQQHYKKRWRNVKDRERLLEVMYNRLHELSQECDQEEEVVGR